MSFLSPFLSFPCLSRGSSFCNHCRAFLFQINDKPSTNRLQWHVHTSCNPTFSRMVRVISSVLPLTVPHLECDYYIEKVTLFTAFPTSTDLILLHPFGCLHLFSLCISDWIFRCQYHMDVVPLLQDNLRFSKKILMPKIHAFNIRCGRGGWERVIEISGWDELVPNRVLRY